MDRNKVGFKFTVWVGEDSLQPWNELCGAALVWTQEQSFLIIVIGMNVVPNDWGSSQDF